MQLSLWVEEDVVLCLSSLWVEEVSEDEVFSSLEDEDFSSLEDEDFSSLEEGLYPVVEVEDFSSVVEEDEDEVFFSLSVEEEDFCFSLSLEEDEDLYSVVEVTVTVTGTVDVCSLLSLVVETVDEDFSLVVEVTGTEDVCSSVVVEETVDVVLYCSNERFVVGGV